MMFHDGETIPGTGLESIAMMAKNQAAFCPCPKNLPETKFFLTLKKKKKKWTNFFGRENSKA